MQRHFRSNSGLGFITKMVIVIILIVAFISGMLWLAISSIPPTPTIEVSGVSLNPSTIKQSQSSTLTFTIENHDSTKGHDVTVDFSTTSPVTFNINGDNLTNHEGVQSYSISLTTSQKSTYSFKVFGELAGGAKSSTYSIPFYFLDENGTKFDTESVSLTVNS